MMKRILPLLLVLVLLLSACGESVPAYSAPEDTGATSEAPTISETPTESTEAVPPPALSDPTEITTYPADTSIVHLTKYLSVAGDAIYFLNGNFLQRYDMEEGTVSLCCSKKHCPHFDDNCGAYVENYNWTYLACHDGKLYLAGCSAIDNYGFGIGSLRFYSVDLTTGERQMLYEEDLKGQRVVLCDVVLSGGKAVVSYDVFAPCDAGADPNTEAKLHRFLSVDLTSGSAQTIMEREIYSQQMYNLWGLNDEHLILAYHNIGYAVFSYSDNQLDAARNYDDYTRCLQRWILLEYPLKEDADISKQIAAFENGGLRLFHYNNFYRGKLYFQIHDGISVYDLAAHTTARLFDQPGIQDMLCLDGRVFYETDEGCFWYEIETGVTHQFLQENEPLPFRLVAETDDDFICQNRLSIDTFSFFRISKEDFYSGNYDALVQITLK